MWRPEDPQGDEAGKVKYDVVQYTRGVVLDLGCGPKKAFPHFIGIDSGKDTELFGIAMKPDLVVADCADLSETIQDASVDAIFSAHLLEHIEDYRAALKDWWRCLKVGGHLVLYLPHKAFYPNIGQPGANPDHKHDFEPADIIDAMRDVEAGWDLVERENRNEGMEYSFLLVFRKEAIVGHRYSWMADSFNRNQKQRALYRLAQVDEFVEAPADRLPEVVQLMVRHLVVVLDEPGIDVRIMPQDVLPLGRRHERDVVALPL